MSNLKIKILVLRFSSIGDIVLTTPVLRNLKKSIPKVELHYLTKTSFRAVLRHNPYIDKLWDFDRNFDEVVTSLVREKFDFIVDLHRNIRTLKLKKKLGVKSLSFDKLNFKKLLLTKTKINLLPDTHIVDRYLDALSGLAVSNDFEGLDYYVDPKSEVESLEFSKNLPEKYAVMVVGAAHFTKVPPVEKFKEILRVMNMPTVLVGGNNDEKTAKAIAENYQEPLFNYCGKTSLDISALLIKKAEFVVTPDTGMMHIAAAYKRPIISLWGNTTPSFGMAPYYGSNRVASLIVEVKNLSCRPCSKIGYDSCPKAHFNCMRQLDVQEVKQWIKTNF
jgi:ADP-heptose:LPS heptosyltransferase